MTPPLRVLVAHAEPPTRQRLLTRLRAQHRVDIVGDCGDADALCQALHVASASGASVDVVFLDPDLPGASRVDLLSAIHGRPGDRPGVVLVTADESRVARTSKDGVTACIFAPFSDERFQTVLQQAVDVRVRAAPPAQCVNP